MLDAPLTIREFAMPHEVPLALIFRETFAQLAGKPAAIFGAQAVNAYVDEPRMTHDLDVLSTDARGLAEEIARTVGTKLHIALRVREVKAGTGFRVYQKNRDKRHVVDVRQVDVLPPTQSVRGTGGVKAVAPACLLAMKVRAYVARKGQVKGLSDHADIHRLLNKFPALRSASGPVADILRGDTTAMATWRTLITERFDATRDDDKGDW